MRLPLFVAASALAIFATSCSKEKIKPNSGETITNTGVILDHKDANNTTVIVTDQESTPGTANNNAAVVTGQESTPGTADNNAVIVTDQGSNPGIANNTAVIVIP